MNLRTFLTIATMVFLTSCDSQTKGKNGVVYRSAVQYNQYIMDNQKSVINIMLEFGKAINHSFDSADHALDKGAMITEEAITNVKGMPAFHGDSAFRDAAVRSFEFYKDVLGNEYRQIVAIRRKQENKTDSDLVFLKSLPAEIGKREEKFDRAFHNAQQTFADHNHLTLVRNEMQDKIDDEKKND